MKALVTGVAGFVGSNLARALVASGWDVVGLDAFTPYYDPHLKRRNLDGIVGPRFRLIESEILKAPLHDLLSDIDMVFHQAGQPGVRKSWGSHFSEYSDHNILATQALLESVKEQPGVRKFVYASSSSVYGEAERYPTLETDRPQPRSPYGVTKLAAEHLCTLYASNFGVPTVSLRYFTVYGPGQRPDMAFTRFALAALSGSEIEIYGDGEQVRDFTYVEDVVRANILAATSETAPGAIYNISGGSHITVNRALDTLESLAGKPIRRKHMPAVPGDVRRTGGDNSRALRELGWSPSVSIEEGLSRHLRWASQLLDNRVLTQEAAL